MCDPGPTAAANVAAAPRCLRPQAVLLALFLASCCPAGAARLGKAQHHHLRSRGLRARAFADPESGAAGDGPGQGAEGPAPGRPIDAEDASPYETGTDPLREIADSIAKSTEKAAKAAEDAAEDAVEEGAKAAQKAIDAVAPAEQKPLMSKINSMRAQLCWMRPDLWNHEACLKFLGLQCEDHRTGKGVCTEFKEGVKEHCAHGANEEEKEAFCKLAKQLKVIVEDEENEDEEAEDEEEAGEETPAPNETKKENPDRDGDGVKNEDDAFPDDPKEYSDLDQDGVGDVVDKDRDGDGVPNDKDAYPDDKERHTDDRDGDGIKDSEDTFPDDPKEWADLDKDGIGDNSDPDRDGDGVENEHDSHPDDPSKAISDRDKDGVPDSEDAFPDDPNEWADLDKDGIGDKVDTDRDGDGVLNEHDTHPDDKSKAISDRDKDGVPDSEDAFPDDPNEWKDTDGDGVGDEADADPHDPNCWKAPCPRPAEGPAPSPAPPPGMDWDKVRKTLPDQGYDEHSTEDVDHTDKYTWTGDWRTEWPQNRESKHESIRRICKRSPESAWCRRHLRRLDGGRRA